MSGLSVQMCDLLPVMSEQRLELRVYAASGEWNVRVTRMARIDKARIDDGRSEWGGWYTELWQGLDAALAWIWREYGTPREEAK